MDDQQRQHLNVLRQTHERRLRVLELQAASFGLAAPAHILIEVDEVKEKIASIDNQLDGDASGTELPPSKSQSLSQTKSSDKGQETSFSKEVRAVFISYAHADNNHPSPKERWADRFVEFLQPLVRQEDFTLSSDQDVRIGDNWHGRIQAQLNGARAVVLLISPAFLASDYIRNSELPVILKNAAIQGVRIFPILILPSLYKRAKYKYPDPKTGPQEFTLSSIQTANPTSKTLIEMTEGEQNCVLETVAEQLVDLLSENPQEGPSLLQAVPAAADTPKAANVESAPTDIQPMAPVSARPLTESLQRESQVAKTAGTKKKARRVVAIMHGIRDEGGWMTALKCLIEKETEAEVAALSPDRIALTWTRNPGA